MSSSSAHTGRDKEKDLNTHIESFLAQMKRRQIKGPHDVALATAQLLLRVVSAARWTHIDQLITQIKVVGKRLQSAQPRELTCGNIVRRVLALIREEAEDTDDSESGDGASNSLLITSMFSLLQTDFDKESSRESSPGEKKDLKPYIIEGIQELIDELRNSSESIAGKSVEMIHENETILTATPNSNTVLKFLLRAAQKRKFTVLIAEVFPNDIEMAHRFAMKLSEAGIEATVITDAMVYSIMGRVGKVILGTCAVLANGGLLATAGSEMICQCANAHRTPVVVCTGIYKLSPMYPFDTESLVEVGDTGKVLNFEEGNLVEKVDVVNPLFDYVPPELVDIYITNLGGFSPSFMYRLVLDNYRQEDVKL
ncbi:beta subunit of the translation initiation factor eIF2B [Myxozyma melibiosi]|uniref:Translation initiation factor eIF2B subunit beta n=1 Tax=Myxozyma melibiosi TaxID=54550 RepID=A0ABR1FEB3_9ASCO